MFKKRSLSKNQEKKRQLITHKFPKSTISEQYRMIRSNIDFSSIDSEIKSILVTSAAPSAGKSTTAANIAVTYAQAGKKVLLIDGDMRKPTIQYTFETKNVFGLSNLVTNKVSIKEAIQSTEIENLFILTSGPIPPNPSELLGSEKMSNLMSVLKENFDIIIIDTPPILAVTDAAIISKLVDGSILVTNVNNNNKKHLIKTKEILENANSNILGIILNNVKTNEKEDYYYYNYYGEKK
ncbi:CpsD/CapB family tyrosine-protein kinase [Macrococcus animalis]|uniref:CpsD/CapB family tyrosine-protein kinase n=1 Tax=Macrococcus animalis TaxID=3395467 RepID=UPI0039BE7CEB